MIIYTILMMQLHKVVYTKGFTNKNQAKSHWMELAETIKKIAHETELYETTYIQTNDIDLFRHRTQREWFFLEIPVKDTTLH